MTVQTAKTVHLSRELYFITAVGVATAEVDKIEREFLGLTEVVFFTFCGQSRRFRHDDVYTSRIEALNANKKQLDEEQRRLNERRAFCDAELKPYLKHDV